MPDLKETAAAKVLGMLAEHVELGPLLAPLPRRSEEPVEPPVPQRFMVEIKPFGLLPKRIPVLAINRHEARGAGREEARRLFPGRSFTVSAVPA